MLIVNLGKIFDLRREGKPIYKYVSTSLFTISTGLLFWGASTYILATFSLSGGFTSDAEVALQYFVYSTIVAVLIALSGIKYSVSNQTSESEKKVKERKQRKIL